MQSTLYKKLRFKCFPNFPLWLLNWYGSNDRRFAKCMQCFAKAEANDYTLPFVVVYLLTLDRLLHNECSLNLASGNTLLLYWHQSLHFHSLSAFCMSVWSYFGHTMGLYQPWGKSLASRDMQIPILNYWHVLSLICISTSVGRKLEPQLSSDGLCQVQNSHHAFLLASIH